MGEAMNVTVVVLQFVGFSCSQIVYVIVYTPAGVPAGTSTRPVAGFSTGTGPPPKGSSTGSPSCQSRGAAPASTTGSGSGVSMRYAVSPVT